jgi:hypothetical protein
MPKDAIREAEAKYKDVFAKWEEKGLVYPGSQFASQIRPREAFLTFFRGNSDQVNLFGHFCRRVTSFANCIR